MKIKEANKILYIFKPLCYKIIIDQRYYQLYYWKKFPNKYSLINFSIREFHIDMKILLKELFEEYKKQGPK